MPDFGAQVGEPWASDLVKELYNETVTLDRRLDHLLLSIQKSPWNLGEFLRVLFSSPIPGLSRSQKHSQMVSQFLQGRSTIKAPDIVELMYSSRDSTPKEVRATRTVGRPAAERRDPESMARWQLREWAVKKVEDIVDAEAEKIASKEGGFRVSREEMTWDFVHRFSLANVVGVLENNGPTLLRLLVAAAIPAGGQRVLRFHPDDVGSAAAASAPYLTYFSRPVSFGSGYNRRDPWVASLML
jgi:hypothetical protein